jgi:hypothetical protein
MDNVPAAQRPDALARREQSGIQSEIDDGVWAQWYDHFHQIVLSGQQKRDFHSQVHQGLSFNLMTAALYLLLSSTFVPRVRHWWCILPACMWVLILFAREYMGVPNARNKWSTLSEQTNYLMVLEPLKEPPTAK